MNASPSHARGAQWRIDAVARLPLRGQRRTSTDFPFHLTRGGVRHLKRADMTIRTRSSQGAGVIVGGALAAVSPLVGWTQA